MTQPYQPYPPKPRRWPWVVAILAASFFSFIFGIVAGSTAPPPTSSYAATPYPSYSYPPPSYSYPSTTPSASAVPNSFSAGQYDVGTGPGDIAPGTYRTTGATSACYFARLSGQSGELGDVITNDFAEGPNSVTVKASDAAVEFSGGCTWTKQ